MGVAVAQLAWDVVMISRRGFFFGSAGIILTPGLLMPVRPIVQSAAFTEADLMAMMNEAWRDAHLWGDGVHDDTKAVQALFRGDKIWHNGILIGGNQNVIRLPAGRFSLSSVI